MNKSVAVLAISLIGSVIAAGCGSTPTPSASGTPHTAQSSPATSTHGAEAAPSSSAPRSTSIPISSSPPVSSQPTSSSGSTPSSPVQLVKQWAMLADTGHGLNIPVGDGQTIDAIQKLWGTVSGSPAGAGTYYTYGSHNAIFGVGVGDQIFDVRSTAPDLKTVSQQDVTKALGAPGEVRYADNTTIYLYTANTDYQILWVFPGGEGHTREYANQVDVFWPQGTVNLMGQTVPNPSIAILSGPAASKMDFSIQNAPAGYQLTEIEWLPTSAHGVAIVNTQPQAVANAQNDTPRTFMAITDGHYELHYTPAMKEETGKVRLIYESPQGQSIIGTTPTITLN